MEQIYACLWRVARQIALAAFMLSVLTFIVPISMGAFLGFCLYGLVLALLIELGPGHRKEIIGVLVVSGMLFLFISIKKREWLWEIYQSYRAECLISLLLPVFFVLMAVFEKKLVYATPVCFLSVIAAAVLELPVYKAGIIGAVYVVISSLIEIAGITAYGKERRERFSGFFLFPFCLCVCLAMLPVSEKPYPYAALRQTWNRIRNGANTLYTELSLLISNRSNSFDVQFTGYSEDGIIGGSLLEKEKPALILSLSGNARANLYLAGNIQNHYEHNKWTYTEEGTLKEELAMDVLELLYAVYQTETEEKTIVWNTSATLTYQGLYTKDMFFPSKLCDFRPEGEYSSEGNRFVSKRSLRDGDRYTFRYLAVNYGSDDLRELIRSREETIYQTQTLENKGFRQWIRKYYPQLQNYVPEEGFEAALAAREAVLRRDYMQIPEYLYKDIAVLTEKVTEGVATDYEKLAAIEKYLQGFVYTVTPGRPEGDAVAEFLFETGEGYCTYFASAFVLMSRAAGIPARYVSGFCIPAYSMGEREFAVGSDRAHAWPEAYLAGIGWLTFEPTAGFAGYHNTPWQYILPGASDGATVSSRPDQEETVTEDMPDGEEYDAVYEKEEENRLSEEIATVVGRMLLILFVFFLLFAAAVCLARFFLKKRRYLLSGEAGKLACLMGYELALLDMLGIGRKPEETLLQYEKRLSTGEIGKGIPPDFSSFIRSYMKSFYGGYEPSIEDREAALRCVRQTEHQFGGIRRFSVLLLRFTFSENML